MHNRNYLAMDFGAGSGRAIVGQYDGERLSLEEIHRFSNRFVDLNGTYYWDAPRMFGEIVAALRLVASRLPQGEALSVGIDTWGTDYGMIDHAGQLLRNVRCMRNADGAAVKQLLSRISAESLFERTGIQVIYGNTIFQLYERIADNDPALRHADKVLMLPDLLAYFLTGCKLSEYSIATTSMLYNPLLRDWDRELIKELGMRPELFPDIVQAASLRLDVLDSVKQEAGISRLHYVPVASHDTASAIAAVPLGEGEAFCSSGTWSLFGIESDLPIMSKAAFRCNFSNEGSMDGRIRFLKNIMGMWILQECGREWAQAEQTPSWDDIVEQAEAARPFRSFINTDEPAFYSAGRMVEKVQSYCARTGQPVPESIGEIARCVYESIAMRYRQTFMQLAGICGRELQSLRIVGGGSRNRLMNRFAASAIGKPVNAGPVEATSIGNVMAQAIESGDIGGWSEARELVGRSFEMERFEPEQSRAWQEAYGEYELLLEQFPVYQEGALL